MVLVRGQQIIQSSPSFTGDTGAIGILLPSEASSVADLFETPVGIAEGSTVWVKESLRVIVSIDRPEFVDLDKRWYGQKPYVGTYRVLSRSFVADGSFDPQKEGFLNSLDTTLSYLTPYLVVSRKPGGDMVGSRLVLDPCNFETRPFSVLMLPPGALVQVPGIKLAGSSQAFVGRGTESYYPLSEGQLNEENIGIGLFLNEGVSLILVQRRIGIAGQVQSARPESLALSACNSQSEKCSLQTAEFLNGNPEVRLTYAELVSYIQSLGGSALERQQLIDSIVPFSLELSAGCLVSGYAIGDLQG